MLFDIFTLLYIVKGLKLSQAVNYYLSFNYLLTTTTMFYHFSWNMSIKSKYIL